jgi:hypothetical protein
MMNADAEQEREWYRRDQADGITPPNLLRDCSFAEHIVRARGKRDRYTSVSFSPDSIREFGDTLWRLKRAELEAAGHLLIEPQALLDQLSRTIREDDKAERTRAVQALRYARRRKEGLVDWRFDIAGVERRRLFSWTAERVRCYFVRA